MHYPAKILPDANAEPNVPGISKERDQEVWSHQHLCVTRCDQDQGAAGVYEESERHIVLYVEAWLYHEMACRLLSNWIDYQRHDRHWPQRIYQQSNRHNNI